MVNLALRVIYYFYLDSINRIVRNFFACARGLSATGGMILTILRAGA